MAAHGYPSNIEDYFNKKVQEGDPEALKIKVKQLEQEVQNLEAELEKEKERNRVKKSMPLMPTRVREG